MCNVEALMMFWYILSVWSLSVKRITFALDLHKRNSCRNN